MGRVAANIIESLPHLKSSRYVASITTEKNIAPLLL
jgi:hypothetical protein